MRLTAALALVFLAASAHGQVRVDGTVTDGANGEALPGAHVLVVGTTLGAATDEAGRFVLALPDSLRGAALDVRASFLGYAPSRARYRPGQPLDFVLRPAPFTCAESDPSCQIVVTGTRTVRELETVAVPIDVIGAEQIEAQGAVRLSDLLYEQAGLTPDPDHGNGLQIQGLDADYTLVLIDGEPVIGRTAGTLDLERLSVVGVERVEVVKGPSSSLYGSDALGGVVNIITRAPDATQASVQSRLETNATRDHTLSGEAVRRTALGRLGARLSLNHYDAGGYALAVPGGLDVERPGHTDTGGTLRLTLRDGTARQRASLTARLAHLRQDFGLDLTPAGSTTPIAQVSVQRRTDWSLAPTLRLGLGALGLSGASALTLRGYAADFRTRSAFERADTRAVTSESRFFQQTRKAEAQADLVGGTAHLTSLGVGVQRDAVEADRITSGRRAVTGGFAFAQHEWMPSRRLSLIASARFDAPGDFASRLSPKLAVQVQPVRLWGEPLRVRAALGSGFKAPTFQERYLDFTNPTVGYSVVGVVDAARLLRRLEAEGAISQFYLEPESVGLLQPEHSWSLNAVADVPLGGLLGTPLDLKIGVFQHRISDLIEAVPVALKTSGQQAFTYFNVARVRTRGVEVQAAWPLTDALRLDASYQTLRAEDLDVLDEIAAGTVFGRDAQNRDYRLTRADYGGLLNRSRHSGTAGVTAHLARTDGTLAVRAVWRTRYGYREVNGNAILDDAREYVPGYVLWNVTLTQPLPRGLQLQLGAKNLLGHTDPARIPTLPGRLLFAGLRLGV